MQPPGDVRVAAVGGDLALQEEEQVLDAAVVLGGAYAVDVQPVDRIEQHRPLFGRDDPLLGEHHGVGAIDRDVVIEEIGLRVGETIRQNVVLVTLCRELLAHVIPPPAG